MNFEVWPEAIELGRMFAAEGYELALVGGPVRDLLLHRKSHDLDFCTSARPEQFEHILRRFGHDGFWDMGRKFGTLGAMRRREDGTEVKVEVTTYRSDTYDPDSRKPEVNYGDTLEGDLSRRDFTVNAMALRVPELEFVDPFGGANDLAKGVLRTPVDPRQSFDDDPLRMMRAVRFVAQLGFRIEPVTAEALSDMVEDVSELVNLHLRFHGYVEEPWTDSAVRRYVKDAGPLYERLNRLTRADTTTQNKRKAMMFSAAMDEMEQRVRDLKEKEDFDAIRPDLNGDEIMQLLSIEPGPMVGKAYKHMLEYRLDNGPVERDVAVAELERWYKEQGE